MKKLILTSLAITTIAFTTNAQLRFGPELGLNIASMSVKASGGNSDISTSSTMGIKIGGIVDFGITDHIYLQPGIFYSGMGTKYSQSGVDITRSLNYLYIPINVLYKLGEAGNGRFFFGLGPTFGLALSGKDKASGLSQTLNIGSDAQKDDVKAMDIGLDINIGYELPMGLFIRGAYGIGLANISPQSNYTVKNSVFTISVGWLFGGK